MTILRGLGVVLGLIMAFVISLLTHIEFSAMLAMCAFILAADSKINDYLSMLYMRALYKNLEQQTKESEKRDGK